MRYHRKTAPGVKDGRVQKKNNWRHETDYSATHQIRVEREPALRGYRHFIAPTDVHAFLGLLPQWRELSIGLTRIVLSARTDCLGWCEEGTVAVCAWDERLWRIYTPEFYVDHARTFARLGIRCQSALSLECRWCGDEVAYLDGYGRCETCDLLADGEEAFKGAISGYFAEFTEQSVQAFLLVHVLVHELGHHHDRMTSPRRRDFTRGEGFAEEYALRHEARIWEAYRRVFGVS